MRMMAALILLPWRIAGRVVRTGAEPTLSSLDPTVPLPGACLGPRRG